MNNKKGQIYSKIRLIQDKVGDLVRQEENKFQKYFFFNELQVMRILKPLLAEFKLSILISDDVNQPFIHDVVKNEKEHLVKYLKKVEVIDTESDELNKLTFSFWACGSNTDLSKAKGSSDTYAVKYALSKLFLIPVKDETDPDYNENKVSKLLGDLL